MGMSPAEVRLRRLLASTPQQGNPMKLLHNMAAMREQLVLLTGDNGQAGLPVIAADRAEEYAEQVAELAQSIGGNAPPLDVWEALQRSEDGRRNCTPGIERKSRSKGEVQGEENEFLLGHQGLSSTLWRRRFQRVQDVDQGRGAGGAGAGAGAGAGGGGGGATLDTATNQLVEKHRQIQDVLIGEIAIFSEQVKHNSLLVHKSIKDTERMLDSTEEAVEQSLSAANTAALRTGFIYKSSSKTACSTWSILFLTYVMFILMIAIIQMTR